MSGITDSTVAVAADAYSEAVKTDAFGEIGREQHLDAMRVAVEAAVASDRSEGVRLYALDSGLVDEYLRHAWPDGSVTDALCAALEARNG